MNTPKISNARKTHIAEAKIFWKNVDYLKAINGLTDHDVACALKRSISTIYNRKSEPETTDLRDVYNAALYFGIEPAARLLIPLTAGLVEPFALDEEGEGECKALSLRRTKARFSLFTIQRTRTRSARGLNFSGGRGIRIRLSARGITTMYGGSKAPDSITITAATHTVTNA